MSHLKKPRSLDSMHHLPLEDLVLVSSGGEGGVESATMFASLNADEASFLQQRAQRGKVFAH